MRLWPVAVDFGSDTNRYGKSLAPVQRVRAGLSVDTPVPATEVLDAAPH